MEITPTTITLKNGLKISHVFNECKLFQIEIIIRAGMLNETKKQLGFAHLIEHVMSFFTSNKYPDSVQNQQMIDHFGLETNAWTSEIECGYYITGNIKHFFNVIDLMFENYIDPTLDETIFEQEKSAVIRELTKIISDIWYPLEHMIQYIQYNGTILQNSVHTEIENIKKNAKLENILEFRHEFYRPEITNVIITSSHSQEEFKKLCKYIKILYFSKELNKPNKPIKQTKPQSLKVNKNNFFYVPIENDDTYCIQITFPIPFDFFDLRRVCSVEYIENILSGGLGSRLYYATRTDLGAVYNIDAYAQYNFKNKKYNYFTIEAETDKEHLTQLYDRVILELGIIKENDNITDKELEQKKNRDSVENEYNICSSSFQKHVEFYKPFIVWEAPKGKKSRCTLSKWLKLKESITQDDIIETSRMIFNPEAMKVYYSGKKPLFKGFQRHYSVAEGLAAKPPSQPIMGSGGG